jgi:hypothetical protein
MAQTIENLATTITLGLGHLRPIRNVAPAWNPYTTR